MIHLHTLKGILSKRKNVLPTLLVSDNKKIVTFYLR